MYYKFSGFSQRLTGGVSPSAYSPQGLRPNVPPESPPIIFATPTRLANEPAIQKSTFFRNRVPELQKLFQANEDIPVHLKRGLSDRLLYRSTVALACGGIFYCLVAIYKWTHPKK